MNKYKKSHRLIATFFMLIFFPTLIPTNLFASNNGPNAFEAASFEPIDAADMVNLATGDMSYVLPLLNVPSPEGGYPLTLSNHAGIAMDQEASWVGLGWNLNPGAINRNINGYPDDVIGGKEKSFIYDSGQSDFYSVGLGGSLYGISVGLGAYWGSNKTFGGSVSMGYGPVGVTVGTGTYGTNVGLGYSGSVPDFASNVSMGVSFKSLSDQGSSIGRIGTGASSSSVSFTDKDYNIQVISTMNDESYAGFYFYFGHTKVKYDLFIDEEDDYTGILYNGGTDTNNLAMYDDGATNILNINNSEKRYLCDNVLLPNWDQYSVQAQGLSGIINPNIIEERGLSHKRIGRPNFTDINSLYFHATYGHLGTFNLNNNIFFEFENTNSSFLRIDRTTIDRNAAQEDSLIGTYTEKFKAYYGAKTKNSNVYSETNSSSGIPLKNGNRKRTGKFVEAFTNAQILTGTANIGGPFFEAKNLNRNQPQTYRGESIGGYRITDVDGKVYHYSLPVINFEIWYKNFSDPNNEDSKFMEDEKDIPYATDWLLTAVTGPDYVDTNGDNLLDKGDYGYWVEFDYGKWSDGYIWNGSSGNYDVIKGDARNEDKYEYYRGRKQIYYLDAVRTRTHTAYFVKSVREDAQGENFVKYQSQAVNGLGFDHNTNCKIWNGPEILYNDHPYGEVTPQLSSKYPVPTTHNGQPIGAISGTKKKYKYADFPAHKSLKLDKIILVKNNVLVENNITINKANGTPLVSSKKAYLYGNYGLRFGMCRIGSLWSDALNNNIYYVNGNTGLKEIAIHQSENVLDGNDLTGFNLIAHAEKVVDFQYDANYKLMPNSNHTTTPNKGKLTLNAVSFLGKAGVSYMPKYQFNYNAPSVAFDINNEDGWGYHKNSPAAWSLSEIITPLGSKINIQYESDDYSAVAAKASRVFNKGMSFYITKNASTNELIFEVSKNTDTGDNTVNEFTAFNDFFKVNEQVALDLFICRRSKYGGSDREVKLDLPEVTGQVTSVNATSVTFKLPNAAYWSFDDQGEGWILNRKFSLTSVKHADGSYDGVVMRDGGNRECFPWHVDYGSGDDINFHYKLASTTTPSKTKGGGIRVKEISTTDEIGVSNKLKYYYNQKGFDKNTSDTNYKSSGSTSFAPSKEYMILPYASELPPPLVMYSTVSMEVCGKNDEVLTRTEYNFETLSDYQNSATSVYNVGTHLVVDRLQNENPLVDLNFSKFNIKNKINNLGRLISVKNYNSKNQLLSSVKNNYYISQDAQDEWGVKQESYLTKYTHWQADYHVKSVSKITYSNQLASTTSLSGGYSTTTYFKKYDFLTGDVLETETISSDGKSYKTTVIPAYNKTQYKEMGPKVDDIINNKNMLTQSAATYSYSWSGTAWQETGVGITTWNNVWSYKDIGGTTVPATAAKEKIWRKHKSYVWNGVVNNGIFQNYTPATDDDFNWNLGVGTQTAEWKQVSEVTLYDHYSKPLEIKDVNNNLSTSKMGDNDTKVMATGNAGYNELFYAGGENISGGGFWLEPEVRMVNAQRLPDFAHTGKYSVKTTSSSQLGVFMLGGQHKAGRYKLSVWVHKTNEAKARVRLWDNTNTYLFNGESYTAGDWVLKTHYFDNVGTGGFYPYVNSIDGTEVYYDDFMLRPVASSITGYVYNEHDELTAIIGSNGLATKFEYDVAGRLVKTYIEVIEDENVSVGTGGFKLKTTNKINYKI